MLNVMNLITLTAFIGIINASGMKILSSAKRLVEELAEEMVTEMLMVHISMQL